MRAFLEARFGAHDAGALNASPIFSTQWREWVLFSCSTPRCRLIALHISNYELQLHVEPTQYGILDACEGVWEHISREPYDLGTARLRRCQLVERERVFLDGVAGGLECLKRRENYLPAATGAALVFYAVIGSLTFASEESGKFLQGAIPGVLAGLVAVVSAAREASRGSVQWKRPS